MIGAVMAKVDKTMKQLGEEIAEIKRQAYIDKKKKREAMSLEGRKAVALESIADTMEDLKDSISDIRNCLSQWPH